MSPSETEPTMPLIEQETHKAAPAPYIELFELENINRNADEEVIQLRYTAGTDGATTLRFGGWEYYPAACVAAGFEQKGGGTLPRPTFRLGLVNNGLAQYLIYNTDLVGWSFKRIRTFANFLDTGSLADPNSHLPIDFYRVERKTSQSSEFVEWELSSLLSHEGKKLPGREIIRDYCTRSYRFWNTETQSFDYEGVTCPYRGRRIIRGRGGAGGGADDGGTGGGEGDGEGDGGGQGAYSGYSKENGFDENNNPATTEANDSCGRTLKSCRARFPKPLALPTNAFPGIDRQ